MTSQAMTRLTLGATGSPQSPLSPWLAPGEPGADLPSRAFRVSDGNDRLADLLGQPLGAAPNSAVVAPNQQ
jgi:hypothetical protein